MNTNKTESIRFFWNGIKVNGGKLIRCFYLTDSSSDSVTISARDYDHLPRDLFTVKNETDLYADYFDSDSATITPAHPLYKYARAAALKSAMRGEPEYIAKLEQEAQTAQQPGRYHLPGKTGVHAPRRTGAGHRPPPFRGIARAVRYRHGRAGH